MTQNNSQDQITIYDDSIEVRLEDETVWLSQAQLAELFQSSKANISEHISNIFAEKELLEPSTVRKFRTVQKEGTRQVSRDIDHYNLDLIISLGYRIKSGVATKFRQWATARLKEYMIKGFALDENRLKNDTLYVLEKSVEVQEKSLNTIRKSIEKERLRAGVLAGFLFLGVFPQLEKIYLYSFFLFVLFFVLVVTYIYFSFKVIKSEKMSDLIDVKKNFDQNWENSRKKFLKYYFESLDEIKEEQREKLSTYSKYNLYCVCILFSLILLMFIYFICL